jgi:hypothetical protein
MGDTYRDLMYFLPNLSTVFKDGDKFYYTSRRGIGIILNDNSGIRFLFKDSSNDDWRNFHDTIVFSNRIVFVPRKAKDFYAVDLNNSKVEKYPFDRKIIDESYIPYLYEDKLMLFGTKTQIFYCIDENFRVSVFDNYKSDSNWKSYRSQSERYICIWDDNSGKIGIIDKYNNSIFENEIDYGVISSASVFGNSIYILLDSGRMAVLNIGNNDILRFIQLEIKPKQNNMIFYNDKLYIMPVDGNFITEVDVEKNYEIKKISIERIFCNKLLGWSEIGNGRAICLINHKENDLDKTKWYEYSFKDHCVTEVPFISHVVDFGIRNHINNIVINEGELYTLDKYLETL